MPTQDIVQLVGALGFPIVACGALFWMINTTQKEQTESNKQISNALTELTACIKEHYNE